MQSLAQYRSKLQERGILGIIGGRLAWYKLRFQMDNWYIGRLIELFGNRIRLNGVILDVNNPLVLTMYKSSMYFGIYEIAERELAARFINRSLPTVEIGGSIGGVSCTVSRLLDDPSAFVVLECNPLLLTTLQRNRDLNHCTFKIEPVALAYGSESISFTIDAHFMMGRLKAGEGQMVSVPTTTLRSVLDKNGFGIINLISDCEGAEFDLVMHEGDLLRSQVKWFIVETHEPQIGRASVEAMLAELSRLGFVIRSRERSIVLALENTNL